MANPSRFIASHLVGGDSRRGFLVTLGKIALLGGAAVAGLGYREALATCGQCPYPCCNGGGCAGNVIFYGCCKGTDGQWYETTACYTLGGTLDCYWTFVTSPNCPRLRIAGGTR
jgi:hypothetical protein